MDTLGKGRVIQRIAPKFILTRERKHEEKDMGEKKQMKMQFCIKNFIWIHKTGNNCLEIHAQIDNSDLRH